MTGPLRAESRPKVAAIGGFMAYFEAVMGENARQDRTAHLRHVIEPLARVADICDLGLFADPEDTARLVAEVKRIAPDVLLVVPTMATPPGPMLEIIEAAGAPVVIACGHGLSSIGPGYDMAELCRHSANVGAAMVESLMRRRGRKPVTVAGFLDEAGFHARLAMAVKAAFLAKRMDGLRVGRLGAPMPGYDHVGLDAAEAAASGFALVDVPLADWAARIAAVSASEIDTLFERELPALLPDGARFSRSPDADRAARLAVALQKLCRDEALDCGSLTCRGPFGVGLAEGAIGCLATSMTTSRGIPFSATGDLVTAIAMLVGSALGGATLYCELDAIDRDRDAFLVANTGEGDFRWCPPGGRCVIREAGAHSGRAVPGLVIEHDLRPGPATMLGAALDRTTSDRLTLLAMEGEVGEPPATGLRVTHGWFKTRKRPAVAAFEKWVATGVPHHGALSAGHLSEAAGWLSQLASFELRTVQ